MHITAQQRLHPMHTHASTQPRTLQNNDGLLVPSSMCVTAPKPGRRLAVMGNCPAIPSATSAFMHRTQGADILVSGAVAPPSSSSPSAQQPRNSSQPAGSYSSNAATRRASAAAPPEPWLHSSASVGLSPAALGQLAAQLGVDRLMLARLDMRWERACSRVLRAPLLNVCVQGLG